MAGDKRQSKPGLYILKALCAIAVVAIHAPVGGLRVEVNTLASLAVPLFFCITGYFIYSDEYSSMQVRLRKSIGKLIPIILLTQFVYLFYPNSASILGQSTLFYLKWVLVGMNHKQIHLWYLHALLQALLLFYLLLRGVSYCRNNLKGLTDKISLCYALVGTVFLLIHFYLSGFIFTQPKDIYWSNPWCYWFRYVWATAMPYIALGIMIRRYESYLSSRITSSIVMPLAMISLLYANAYLVALYCQSLSILFKPILQVASVIVIFVTMMYSGWGRVGRVLSFIGQYLSADIYYWHIVVLLGVSKFLPHDVYIQWGFFFTLLLSLLLSLALHHGKLIYDKL